MSKFWMVKGVGPTNHQHTTEESARKEAHRLANQHPNCPFYVMEAKYFVRATRVVEQTDCVKEEPKKLGGWRKARPTGDAGKTAFHSEKQPDIRLVPGDGTVNKEFVLQCVGYDGCVVGTNDWITNWPMSRTWVWDETLDPDDIPF